MSQPPLSKPRNNCKARFIRVLVLLQLALFFWGYQWMDKAPAPSAVLAAVPAAAASSGSAAAVPDSLSPHPLQLQFDGRRAPLPDSLSRVTLPHPIPDAETLFRLPLVQQAVRYATTLAGAEGYLAAAIDSLRLPAQPGDPLVLLGNRGCAHTLAFTRITLTNTPGDWSEEQLREFEAAMQGISGSFLRTGRRYRADLAEQEIGAVLRFWEREGHLFAQVRPELRLHECAISLDLATDPGPLVRADELRFSGVSRNNPDFLARVSGIREGSILDAAALRNARLSLENTGLLSSVEDLLILQETGTGRFILEIVVQERRTNAIDLLFGYVPDPGGGGTVVGSGDLVLRNVFLPGSRLDLQFERLQQFVTRLDMGYESRFIGNSPFGAGARFRFEQQDTLYQVRNLQFSGRYRLSSTTDLIAGLRQEVSVSGALPVQQQRVLDATSLFTGFGIEFRDTDRLRNPTRGATFFLLAETGVKRLTDANRELFTERSRLNQQEVHFRAQAYLSPFRRQVVAPSLHGFLSLSPEYTESDLNRFGGARNLRGYREEQFQASRMLWSDAEYRYLLDEDSYAFVFGALGWYERPVLIFEGRPAVGDEPARQSAAQREWLRSWGFGFAVGTPLGTMQFSYALGRGDTFGNGKVHVGLRADI